MLLRVLAQSLKPVKLFSQQLPTFLFSVIAEASLNDVGSVCTVLPTLLGPRTLIPHGLQRLMGCIFPTVHCRSQTCCIRLHTTANKHETTPNIVARSCCARLHAALASNTDEDSFITRSRATNVCEAGGRDEALRTSALKTKLSLKSNS